MQILIGCDPEVFVSKGGQLVSGYGLIPGTKKKPFPVKDGAVQVDGMALEFNTNPASTSEEFRYNINSVLNQLRQMVPEHDLLIESVARFGADFIKKQPKKAVELGCDPDFNAYTNSANPRPNGKVDYRTAAGHIHIGWTSGEDSKSYDHMEKCQAVAMQLDVLLGVPSVLFDDGSERRKLYGAVGCFRPKSYGVEYRVLSNRWLHSGNLINFVYAMAVKGVEMLMAGNPIFLKYTDTQEVINTSHKERAIEIVNEVEELKEWKHVLG